MNGYWIGSPVHLLPTKWQCAVVGVHDELKGQIPAGFLVPEKGLIAIHKRFVRSKTDVKAVQNLLRHSDVHTTGTYVCIEHLAPRNEARLWRRL